MNRSLARSFWTQVTPLPSPSADYTGKTVIVTGANRGIGFEAARHFVRLGAHKVVLGCRDTAAGLASQRKIEAETGKPDVLEVWEIDLAKFDSVRRFCRRASGLRRLDIVVANAGLMTSKLTSLEGYESQVTVNVISTWLMCLMLIPFMRKTHSTFYRGASEDIPHVTVVGSNGHFYTQLEVHRRQDSIFESMRGDANMVLRYHDTKLVSLFFARSLADQMNRRGQERLEVVVNMVDPGYCQSDMMRERPYPFPVNHIMSALYWVLARTAEMGSRTLISAASAGAESHGLYLEDCGMSTPSGFIESQDGQNTQKRVYEELCAILETIEPGIMGLV